MKNKIEREIDFTQFEFEFITYNEEETIRSYRRQFKIWTPKQVLIYCKLVAKSRGHKLKYVKIGKNKIYGEINEKRI